MPDHYYGAANGPISGAAAGAGFRKLTLAGPRQWRLELEGLDAQLASSSRVELSFILPDTQGSAKCSHPGMTDMYFVSLHLDFDRAAHTVSASFGPVHAQHGECGVAGGLGGAAGDRVGGASMLACVAALLARARRRRNRRADAA